ncbi:MAG: hypothetical protein HY775_04260 [Acidobacteria bacterium]|nr:hypothetical protein [Acidobacteriota bacterium]
MSAEMRPVADREPAPELPNGPAMAAVVAAAAGTFVLGLFTTLAEASESLAEWLKWSRPVGPLAGKIGLGLAAWAGTWIALGFVWRRREIDFRRPVILSAVLIGLGVLGTFPTFFERFAAG